MRNKVLTIAIAIASALIVVCLLFVRDGTQPEREAVKNANPRGMSSKGSETQTITNDDGLGDKQLEDFESLNSKVIGIDWGKDPDKLTPEQRNLLIRSISGLENLLGVPEELGIGASDLEFLENESIIFGLRMRQLCMQHLEEDYLRTSEDTGDYVFHLKPFKEGAVELSLFRDRLINRWGESKGFQVLDRLVNKSAFGHYGEMDMTMTFSVSGDDVVWKAKFVDPNTSDGGARQGKEFDNFLRIYGPILEIE